ncbi:putative bifunctional diguanylate cyclase/phosphodiesterase [Deinococcus sedimenti]|uniref:GGDEF-domain containing protein n=1 Tax=Deinococcus sedimenti TaxID=1867090 RepID=A0ABQ2S3R2_9DEIO|nr:EAL domain-containing protein [Deinococcus sedimenti]GGR83132.1 GGDEF-domain containing protein [Deinococcus sedimenti]
MTHPATPLPTPSALELELLALEGAMYNTPERTDARIRDLLRAALDGGDTRAVATAHLMLGGCALYTGQLPSVKAELSTALALSQDLGDPRLIARCLNGLGLYHDRAGEYDHALQSFLDSLRYTQAVGDDAGSFRALNNLASLHADTGNLAQARAFHERSVQLAEVMQSPIMLAAAMTHLVVIHSRQGHPQRVLDLADEHLNLIERVGPPRWVSTVLECVSRALLRTNRPDEALRVALTDLDAARTRHDDEGISRLACAAAQVYLTQGRPQDAAPLLAQSLELSRRLGSRPVQILALEGLSALHEQTGNHTQALRYAREHHALEREVHEREVDARSQLLTAEIRLELLNRETEIERLRNVELAQANQQLRVTQQDLLHRATHDPLTGVANRAHFNHLTADTLSSLQPGELAALIFIDLDRFKAVNDTLGHPAGDTLLQHLARRLQLAVRTTDVVGRMGGDEFTVLLRRVAARTDAMLVAEKLATVVNQPFDLGGHEVTLTASIGCAVAPQDGMDGDTLQQHADTAMYRAKRTGGNRVLRFETDMGEPGEDQLLERELRGALDRGELCLHYQGCYALRPERLVGFEALLRWDHPRRGLIPPGRFIPMAEDTRLILPIGEWVLREACRQAAEWSFPELDLCISVNVSPLQFDLPHFVDTVRAALDATGLPARHLIVELTESLVMRDLERAQTHIRELKTLGVQIAMDDFGTGYSSLSLLEALPFDRLKVDRSFTRHLSTDRQPRVTALMGAIIQLAQTLEMQVTVEGVEEQSQSDRLRDLGCDHVQGFLFARPVGPDEAARLIPGATPDPS